MDIPKLKPIVQAVLEEYALPRLGMHGVTHWARVLANGMWLAEETGADTNVVQLFAVFHDCRRINEGTDPNHGRRGAEKAAELRGVLFDLDDDRFALLHDACAGHTDGLTTGDITVQTCWDADRLDLGRVGICPHPRYLCTDMAQRRETINGADGRARFKFVPDFVNDHWGIETVS